MASGPLTRAPRHPGSPAAGTAWGSPTGSASPARTRWRRSAPSWRCSRSRRDAWPGAPPPEVSIARVEGAYSAGWSNWTWDSILVDGANCREVIDNVADMAHFFYIHFAFPTYFKNVFEGHIASQYLRTRSRPDVENSNYAQGTETTLRSEAS